MKDNYKIYFLSGMIVQILIVMLVKIILLAYGRTDDFLFPALVVTLLIVAIFLYQLKQKIIIRAELR